MGTGISGVIPIEFYFDEERDKNEFLRTERNRCFLNYYTEIPTTKRHYSGMYYKISYPDFLASFKEYYFGFYSLLEDDEMINDVTKFNDKYDEIVKKNDLDAFLKHFKSNDSFYDPHFSKDASLFSTSHIVPCTYLKIYTGSYKAILEEYSTLDDMEILLSKAYDHPLAKITSLEYLGRVRQLQNRLFCNCLEF